MTSAVRIGDATLYHGNCLDALRSVEAADIAICDLPFGTTRNSWDSVLPMDWLWGEYDRVCAGRAVLFSHGMFTAKLMTSNPSAFKYKIVWEKSKATNFLNAKKQPLRAHEDICVFGSVPYRPQMSEGAPYNKGRRKDQHTGSYNGFEPVVVKSDGGRYPRDVIYFPTAESEGPVLHGTQKPLALMRYLIETYSAPGDTILDNTMGVGTTGVAALDLGRKFIGIEKDPEYFAAACDRIAGLERIAA